MHARHRSCVRTGRKDKSRTFCLFTCVNRRRRRSVFVCLSGGGVVFRFCCSARWLRGGDGVFFSGNGGCGGAAAAQVLDDCIKCITVTRHYNKHTKNTLRLDGWMDGCPTHIRAHIVCKGRRNIYARERIDMLASTFFWEYLLLHLDMHFAYWCGIWFRESSVQKFSIFRT